jgi:hypothetical protein
VDVDGDNAEAPNAEKRVDGGSSSAAGTVGTNSPNEVMDQEGGDDRGVGGGTDGGNFYGGGVDDFYDRVRDSGGYGRYPDGGGH